MAISILSEPDFLQPVYSVQEYTLYDASNYSQDGFYYEFTITVGSDTRVIQILKDENNKAVIDVQAILQTFLISNYADSTNIAAIFTDLILEYSVIPKSVWAGGSSTGASITKKVFNGIDRFDDPWDASVYEFRTDSSGLFFTAYHGERYMTIDDEAKVLMLYGQDGNIDSSINGITYTRYNGTDVSTYTHPWGMVIDYTTFLQFSVDPSVINAIAGAGFIDSLTTKITVAESTGLSETLVFNIVKPDTRFNRYYRVKYIDHLGSTDYYNFTKASINNITISSTGYVNDRSLKKFGTEVEDEYTISTDWMCEDRSQSLKDLWYSPLVSIAEDWKWLDGHPYYGYAPIIIKDTTKQILNRFNVKGAPPIKYSLNFRYAKEYQVQHQ